LRRQRRGAAGPIRAYRGDRRGRWDERGCRHARLRAVLHDQRDRPGHRPRLSQVYGFVKQSGGHVKIYSEPGHGTTVRVYLPRARDDKKKAGEIPLQRAAPPSAYGKETILVVEDDADVRAFICATLEELKYTVLQAYDAASALQVLERESKIDLLLTDVILPGPNGRELASAALTQRPGLKVLFMTGYSRNAIVHQGRLDEGVQLIQKPLTQDSLAAKVRAVLDLPSIPLA
jgi:CheY-like chemotaxis protein